MGVTVDSVIVSLEAKMDAYMRDVNRAASNTDAKMKSIERAVDNAAQKSAKSASFLGTAAKSFAAALSVDAVIRLTRAGLEYASSIGSVAQGLGVGTKLLQEFRFAVIQNGGDVAAADAGLGKLTETLGKAFDANKGAVAAFDDLKLSLKDLAAASDVGRLNLVSDAISKIEDPATKAARSSAVFGDSYKKLLPTLDQGSAGFARLAEEARAFGVVLSESEIRNADVTAKKINALTSSLQVKISSVVAENAQAIGDLSSALIGLATNALKAVAAYSQFRNVQGLKSNDRGVRDSAIGELISSGSGRAAYQNSLNEQINRNSTRRKSYALRGVNNDETAALDQNFKNLIRQKNAISKLDKIGYTGPVQASASQGNGASITPVSGSNKRNGPKAPNGPKPKDPNDLLRKFTDDYQRLLVELQDATSDLTNTIQARAEAEIAGVDASREREKRANDANEDLSNAQKAALNQKEDEIANSRISLIERKRDQEILNASLQVSNSALENDQQILALSLSSVRTLSERRDIELRILELSYQRERAELELVVASKTASDAEKKIAANKLKSIGQRQNIERGSIIRDTEGPLQSMLRGIPETAAQVNESLEKIAANGLQSLTDGIAEAITSGKSLGDIFSNIADQIIKDLLRIAIQQVIIKPLLKLLGGKEDNSTGLLSDLQSLIPSVGAPGRASGGAVSAGQLYRVNENGTEGFRPAGSGTIIPLGQMANARGGGNTVVQPISFDLRGAVMTTDILAQMNALARNAANEGAQNGAILAAQNQANAARRRL